MMPKSPDMKKLLSRLSLLVITLFAFGLAGCHHQQAVVVTDQPKTLAEGVTALRASLATASQTAKNTYYDGVAYNVRYGDYAKASAALQTIAADPSLNDQQKQLVNQVSNLLQQAIADKKNAAPPAQ
jgi:hypothetical protein